MLKLYILLAIRNLRKHRSTTLINVLGLAIGLVTMGLIALYVNEEARYDRFHSKAERIYRLTEYFSSNSRKSAILPYVWRPHLIDELSEVQNATSFQLTSLVVKKEDDVFMQDNVLVTDTSFLQIFDFPAVAGASSNLLFGPTDLLLTEELAVRYFGSVEAALGQELDLALFGNFERFQVQGIVVCPRNSHVQFEMIIPDQLYQKHSFNPPGYENWSLHFVFSYLLMNRQVDTKSFGRKLSDFLKRHDERLAERYYPTIQALEDIYLRSDLAYDFSPRGSQMNNNILLLVGWMIFIISLINYVNLSTARSAKRLREVGIRKVFGSNRQKLVVQFLVESYILSHVAFLIALLTLMILLPQFNEYSEKAFSITDLVAFDNLSILLLATSLAGIAGGAYPAWRLSSIRPITALQQTLRSKAPRHGISLRGALVIVQFVIAVLLIAGTGVMVLQIRYMLNKDLGFDMEQTIVVNDLGTISANKVRRERLKGVLSNHPEVVSVSGSSTYPGIPPWTLRFAAEGADDATEESLACIFTDDDFVPTYAIKIIDGRNLDDERITDSDAFLINEAAVRQFAADDSTWLTDPIGKRLKSSFLGVDGHVVGVFQDIHYEALHLDVKPLVLLPYETNYFNINIRLETDDLPATLEAVGESWKELFPEVPFNYSFTDDQFGSNYANDRKLQKLVGIFSVVAVAIAAIGLFGLAVFTANQRRREIAIRKVMGASESRLIADQTKSFVQLAIFSNLLACPLVILFTNMWLSSFAYRIKVPLEAFGWTFLITLLVTVTTTGFEAIKTARSNPAKVLNTE
ncbi:MAG: ABC transporter permease [Bacteroidota bacterium]